MSSRRRPASPPKVPPKEDLDRVRMDLGIHRVELEAQGEALRDALSQIESSREELIDLYDNAPVGYLTLDTDGTIKKLNFVAAQMLGQARGHLPGMPLIGFVLESDRDKFRNHLMQLRTARTTVVTQLTLKGPLPVIVQLSTTPQGGHALPGGTYKTAMVDITQTVNLQNGLAEQLAVRTRRERLFGAMNRINDIIHAAHGFEETIRGTLPEAVAALGCDTTAVTVRNGNAWIIRYVHGFPDSTVGMSLNDDEERHALLAIETKKPILVSDAFNDERVNREHMWKYNIRSVIVVPLLENNATVGVMFFNWHRGQITLDKLHEDFVITLGSSLSLAFSNATVVAALRESEERFRTMADSTPVMMWVTNARGEIKMVNRAMEEFTGIREALFESPDNWLKLIHPEDKAGYMDLFTKAVETQSKFEAEARVQHISGEWRWVHFYGAPRFSTDGKFLGHVGSSPDITEHKKVEEALARSEKNLRLMVESAEEPMIVVNEHGVVESASRLAAQLLGYSSSDLLGANVTDMIEFDSRLEAILRLNDFREHASQPQKATLRVKTKSGRTEWISLEAGLANPGGLSKKYLVKLRGVETGTH